MGFHLLTIVLALLNLTRGANILAMLDIDSQNNYHWKSPFLLALVDKGYNVTILCTHEQKKMGDSSQLTKDEDNWTTEDVSEESDFVFMERSVHKCNRTLYNDGVKELLDSVGSLTYDLVIYEPGHGDCFLGLLHHFGSPPIVALNIGSSPQRTLELIRKGYSCYDAANSSKMLFYQSIFTYFTCLYRWYQWNYYYLSAVNEVIQQHFGSRAPKLTDILQNIHVMMINTLPEYVCSPQEPVFINIAGIHMSVPGSLPKDLQEFLDEANQGAILFSLGCSITMTREIKEVFVTAFYKLHQKVLWNCDNDTPFPMPKNVKAVQWFPDADILAHQNMHLFITQASLLRMQEAIFQGVPLIGLSFGSEQYNNIQTISAMGVGVELDYKTITEETVLHTVNKILNNNSFMQSAQKEAAYFRDQPETPVEQAVRWCEYIIRHKGVSNSQTMSEQLLPSIWHRYLSLESLIYIGVTFFLAFMIKKYIDHHLRS